MSDDKHDAQPNHSDRQLLQHDLDRTPGTGESDTSPSRGRNSVSNNDQRVGGDSGSRSSQATGQGAGVGHPGEGSQRQDQDSAGELGFGQDPSEHHRGHGPDPDEEEQGILDPGGDDPLNGDEIANVDRDEPID